MILALDIGTSTVKGAVFSESGTCLSTYVAPIVTGVDDNPSIHEIPAVLWMEAIRRTVQAVGVVGPVDAVVVSGNGPTLLPVDADGHPLHDAITWMDRRAEPEAAEVSAVVGGFVDPSFDLPKALWFKRRRPEIYEKTDVFLSCPEYVIRILTGASTTILPAPGYERYYWDARALSALDLDAAKFPAFVRPGALVGEVNAAGEEVTGLRRGTTVIAGGPDFLAALVGTATTKPGRACDRAGTSEGINLCAAKGVDDVRLLSMPHIVEPYANVSGTISASGKAVEWFKRASGRGDEGYEDFFEDICQSQPGAGRLIFLPYLSGERAPIWDPAARGVFIGLTLAHGRKEMSRAVVESTAFAMRDVIEVMEYAGATVRELRVTGSPGKNPVWNQIKADVTNRPIALPRFEDAELLGDLCFALAAMGRYASPAEAADALVKIGRVYEPDPTTKGLYDELFGVYRDSYAALRLVFRRLENVPVIERSTT